MPGGHGDLVGIARINTVGTKVHCDLAIASVEGMASAALAALALIDGGEETLELLAGQWRVVSIAAVDGSTIAIGARDEVIVDSTVREACECCLAGGAHALVAAARAVAVIGEANGGASYGSNGNHDEGD